MNGNTNEIISIFIFQILHESNAAWTVLTPHTRIFFYNNSSARNLCNCNSGNSGVWDSCSVNFAINFRDFYLQFSFRKLVMGWHIYFNGCHIHATERLFHDMFFLQYNCSLERELIFKVENYAITVVGY